jgi:hypothetical protein
MCPASYIPILGPIGFKVVYKTIRRQFADHSPNVIKWDVIAWEYFHLETFDIGWVHPTVIAKSPQSYKQQTRRDAAFHYLC